MSMEFMYCPKCQSCQNMNVTVTKTKTIAKSNTDNNGTAADTDNNGKNDDKKIINVDKNGRPFTLVYKNYQCSKCFTFVKSEIARDYNL